MSPAIFETLEPRTLLAVAPIPEMHLTAGQVDTILAHAASQAIATQAIVVVDREGVMLGTFAMAGTDAGEIAKATARARTAAYFESSQNAFTTRTARFIIQDHFPQPVRNTPGGPLYGVEFSSLPGSDVISNASGISGDPGGVPLYSHGKPVGGIGVAGDGVDVAPRSDLAVSEQKVFDGREEKDLDEAVARAGAKGFMAPEGIRARHIFVEGLRFPFVAERRAHGNANQTTAQLTMSGTGAVQGSIIDSPASSFPSGTFAGVPGQVKNAIVDSNDVEAVKLTAVDVQTIIEAAVKRARETRAGIRKPNGVMARVHIAVVDRDGDIVGVFKMDDGTNFSYDVAVQKARTAAFFSDDIHAFSTRAVGFMAQPFFPAGIDATGSGPLFHLQNQLSAAGNLHAPLGDGITIFPGGFPLYKDGQLVGAIGVSGDGVDQDDLIAYWGAKEFQAAPAIRSDRLGRSDVVAHIMAKVTQLASLFVLDADVLDRAGAGLERLNGFRLPYVKFPRNPGL